MPEIKVVDLKYLETVTNVQSMLAAPIKITFFTASIHGRMNGDLRMFKFQSQPSDLEPSPLTEIQCRALGNLRFSSKHPERNKQSVLRNSQLPFRHVTQGKYLSSCYVAFVTHGLKCHIIPNCTVHVGLSTF